MGVDLSLLPFPKSHLRSTVSFAHSVLQTNRNSILNDMVSDIEKEHGQDVPEDFTTYLSREPDEDCPCEGTHYGVTTQTPYGESLQYVPVATLRVLSVHPEVSNDSENAAVWAYLCALPDYYMIALYWH